MIWSSVAMYKTFMCLQVSGLGETETFVTLSVIGVNKLKNSSVSN